MKNVVLSLALFLFCIHSFAQNANYPLKLEKRKVYQNDVVIKGKELRSILLNNPSSSSEYKIFQKKQTINSVFLLSGVGLAALSGFLSYSESHKRLDAINSGNLYPKEANYSGALVAAGAGLVCIIVSIPFNLKAKRSFKKSIELYNAGIKNTHYKPVDFNMNLSLTGVRVSMRF